MKPLLLGILILATGCAHNPPSPSQKQKREVASWPLGVKPYDLLKQSAWEMDCSTTVGTLDPALAMIVAKSSFFEYYDPRSKSTGAFFSEGIRQLEFLGQEGGNKSVRAYGISHENPKSDIIDSKTQDFPVKMSINYYEDPIVEISFKSFRTTLARVTHWDSKERFIGPLWVTVTGAPDRIVGSCLMQQKESRGQ